MKAYIFFDNDNGRAYAVLAKSANDARGSAEKAFGVNTADMVRVEVLPYTPKLIEWQKLLNVSRIVPDEVEDEE